MKEMREEIYRNLTTDEKLRENLKTAGRSLHFMQEKKGGQKRILTMLLEQGEMNQKDLTILLKIQPGSASELLRKLEDAELITRVPDLNDRRNQIVALTEDGRVLAEHDKAKAGEEKDGLFESLTDEEKELMIVLLEKLNADWEKKFPPRPRKAFPPVPPPMDGHGPRHPFPPVDGHGPHHPMPPFPPHFPDGRMILCENENGPEHPFPPLNA